MHNDAAVALACADVNLYIVGLDCFYDISLVVICVYTGLICMVVSAINWQHALYGSATLDFGLCLQLQSIFM